jgi:hypothetical protein
VKFDIKVNSAELRRKLEARRRKAIAKKKQAEAFMPGAKILRDAAVPLAPVDTGRLADDIKVVKRGVTVKVGSDLRYARYAEFIHKPYLYKARDQNQAAIHAAILEAFKSINDIS